METAILVWNAIWGIVAFIFLANFIPFTVMAYLIVRSVNKESN